MASANMSSDFLTQASAHFANARPFFPMYIHLITSALFPIYTGAHASLSRPSSAAKATKRVKQDAEDEDEDENNMLQQMEGMSNKDAIVLPITAGLVLAGLYYLITKYGAEIINLIMGYYFSGVGVYSVSKLVNDTANIAVNFALPSYYAQGGALWRVVNSERKAVRDDGRATGDEPNPARGFRLPQWLRNTLWSVRAGLRQKYTVKAFIRSVFEAQVNATVVNILSASVGVGTIVYVNLVSRPWFLTNLQGFAVSYSALQFMSPTTFETGTLILGALFCYDIWAVFFTPLMVTVAKNLDQPIKLLFPRPDEPGKAPGEPPIRSYSMLGLGDIVLPGIMIGLALRFDLYLFYLKKQKTSSKTTSDATTGETKTEEVIEKQPYVTPTGHWGDKFWTMGLPTSKLPPQLCSSFPKHYFTASMIGYVIGMIATLGVMSVFQHAQPALLYLVPGVLISLWGTASVKGELTEMWEFSEAVTAEQLEEDEAKEDQSDEKEIERDAQHKGLFERLWQELWSSNDNGPAPKSGQPRSKDDEQKAKSTADNDGVYVSFSISRYDSKSYPSPRIAKATPKEVVQDQTSLSASESSEEPVMVSSADLDETSNTSPRRRTRSTKGKTTS